MAGDNGRVCTHVHCVKFSNFAGKYIEIYYSISNKFEIPSLADTSISNAKTTSAICSIFANNLMFTYMPTVVNI